MSVYGRILLAGLGSALLLLGALGFQYLGELPPCALCIWQRWPHAVAVAIALAAMTILWRQRRALSALGAIAAATSAGIGVYHVGVEQKWWEGPTGCTGAPALDLDPGKMLEAVLSAPLVRCDDILWDLFGISMAGWNVIFSAGLAILWIFAAYPRTPTRHIAPA